MYHKDTFFLSFFLIPLHSLHICDLFTLPCLFASIHPALFSLCLYICCASIALFAFFSKKQTVIFYLSHHPSLSLFFVNTTFPSFIPLPHTYCTWFRLPLFDKHTCIYLVCRFHSSTKNKHRVAFVFQNIETWLNNHTCDIINQQQQQQQSRAYLLSSTLLLTAYTHCIISYESDFFVLLHHSTLHISTLLLTFLHKLHR